MLKRKNSYRTRLAAVRDYLKGGTLKEAAARHRVHYITLFRWVRQYRHGGPRNLPAGSYAKPWNRASRDREEAVMMLKERDPGLTVRQARDRLKEQGAPISTSGIYGIWRRYNLVRRSIVDPLTPLGPLTPELKKSLAEARLALRRGKESSRLREAAAVVNRMPYFPREGEDVLFRIPEKYLNARRRLDRLYPQFVKMPMPEFRDRMRRIKRSLEKAGYNYSSLIAGLNELNSLQWMRTPREEIRLNRELVRRKGALRDPVINFQLTLLCATANVELGRMEESREAIRKTRRLLRLLPHAAFYESYGDLMTFIGDYRASLVYYHQAAAKNPDPKTRIGLNKKIALSLVIAGDYPEATRYITRLNIKPGAEYYEEFLSCRAFQCYGLGRFEQAAEFVRMTLDRAEKHQFRNTIYSAAIVRAAVSQALAKTAEARATLAKYLKLMEKYKMVREAALLGFLLDGRTPGTGLRKLPIFQMIERIKAADRSRRVADYRRCLQYARQKGLSGFLHRYIVFYPGIVLNLLRLNRRTFLPNTILRFPIFNREVPTYSVKFLGRTVLFRNQEYQKFQLRPREEALLVHIALKMGEPGQSIPVDEIHRNFWPKSGDQASRLSHLLVSLKRELTLPSYLISVSTQLGVKSLVNRGFYMTTDYQDFENNLMEAHALERAGEWAYARAKFLDSFRLFRAEPFRHAYDDWSEAMRRRTIGRFEQEAERFARLCWSRNDRSVARRVSVLLRRLQAGHPEDPNSSLT